MISMLRRLLPLLVLALAVPATPQAAFSQETQTPPVTSFAPVTEDGPLATAGFGEVTLVAQLTADSAEIPRGLVWRVFKPGPGPDGKLPLVASAQGGTQVFQLEPGSYLVHATFGRAGATKRISVTHEARRESLVLEAGGLKLDAVMSGGVRVPADELLFSIYEATADADGDRALIIPDVKPGRVVRLNAGTYHVVSKFGNVNATIRSDIRVDAGKLTEATVEHRAAEITLKLVREANGEAIADTAWFIVSGSGDPVFESVGAYASMVLAEGEYVIIAKNRDRIYQRNYTVESGHNEDVEVVTTEAQSSDAAEGAD
jgi:hypothetical protein